MKIINHIDKILWTGLDKFLYIIYGFVFLIQISLLTPEDFALYSILLALNTWIFIISDSFSLQIIIQYGFNENTEKKANLYALIFHIVITLGISLILFILKDYISLLFNEVRLIEVFNYLPLLSFFMIPRTYFGKLLLKKHKIIQIFWMDFFFFFSMSLLILYYKYFNLNFELINAVNIYYIGTVLSSIFAIIISFKDLKIGFRGSLPLKKILQFNVPFTITYSIANLTKQLDILLYKLFFDLNTIGIYQAAKSLYRLFEEGVNGANGLIYPALIKHYENNNKKEIFSIVSKGISLLLISYLIISLILVSGFAEYLINFIMKSNYINSINYFKILLIGAIFLPFSILNFLITTSEKHNILLKNVIISFLISLLLIFIIGISKLEILIPVGLISYNIILSLLNINYVKKNLLENLTVSSFLRGFNDIYGLLLKKRKN